MEHPFAHRTTARATTLAMTVLGLLGLSVAPQTAAAGTVVRLDLPELVANSTRIGTVEVVETRSFRRKGRIFTDATLEFVDKWKGDGPDRVVVRQPGGRIGDVATQVPGVPRFREGRRALVFLEARPNADHFVLTGLAQGQFRVVYGPDGEHKFAVPDLHGLRLVRRQKPAAPDPKLDEPPDHPSPAALRGASAPDFQRRPILLEEFRRRVRELVRQSGGDR
ncbi:MAG: hypothetical protein ABEL76_01355 [Bradymonadaceae bacterium]